MISFLVLVWAFLAAIRSVSAAPASLNDFHPYTISGVHTPVKRQASQRWPARRNINDLIHDVPQWSLFVQALNKFQQQDESFTFSYHEIAGIHGRPYHPWNNAPQGAGSPTTGYCTHGNALFLTWHRPYVALYEQIIASTAQDIVKKYPSHMQSQWQAAADQLRIPYWDWAVNSTMPSVVEQPMVQITNSSGQTQFVNNPLYQYKFQNFPLNDTWFPTNAGDGFLAKYPQTMRGVATEGGPSNPALSNSYMSYYNFKKDTWYALTRNKGAFNDFSTTQTGGTSLEAVHNNVHDAVGASYGHMSALSYAAFDPIFWLHHANVDRLYALWQAVNPDSFLTPTTEPFGTFAIPPQAPEDASTPLSPFASSGDAPYYTSDSSRMPSVFGYTYPEIPDWNVPAAQLAKNVSNIIHKLYNPNGQFKKRDGESNGDAKKGWFVGVKVNKFGLQGDRFHVRLFLGDVPKDPQDWISSPSRIGSTTIFPPPHKGDAPFPVVHAYSEYSLVEALNDVGQNQEDINAVVDYLKNNLQWRVQKFDGTSVPTEEVPSLEVTVQNEVVTMGSDELPTYSDVTIVSEVTSGKAGGFSG